jgi:hypothetical protein
MAENNNAPVARELGEFANALRRNAPAGELKNLQERHRTNGLRRRTEAARHKKTRYNARVKARVEAWKSSHSHANINDKTLRKYKDEIGEDLYRTNWNSKKLRGKNWDLLEGGRRRTRKGRKGRKGTRRH